MPGMGQSPQFHAYLLFEVQHSQQNAPKRDIFGKYFLILVDNAPNRGYNEITIKQETQEIPRNGSQEESVKAVNKTSARIGWGYLDYLGETDLFEIKIDDTDEDEPTVIGYLPNGNKVYRWVGPHHWNDCSTIEEAIASAIHGMAASAHNTY